MVPLNGPDRFVPRGFGASGLHFHHYWKDLESAESHYGSLISDTVKIREAQQKSAVSSFCLAVQRLKNVYAYAYWDTYTDMVGWWVRFAWVRVPKESL